MKKSFRWEALIQGWAHLQIIDDPQLFIVSTISNNQRPCVVNSNSCESFFKVLASPDFKWFVRETFQAFKFFDSFGMSYSHSLHYRWQVFRGNPALNK